jgi:FkbM family methyltransferase
MARRYARLSRRARDWPGLALLGIAKYRDFSNSDLSSGMLRRLFPVIKVRPDLTEHKAVLINSCDKGHILIFDEVIVENVYDLSLVPFTPDLIIDCGGHIGLFTARAAGQFPTSKLVVFEPMPKNAAMIKAMVALNKLSVEIRPEAVSDVDGELTFYERTSYGGSFETTYDGIVATYPVKVRNLVNWLKAAAPAQLLLKMDIEGEEENLLPKLLPYLPEKTSIFFETHTGAVGWDKLTSLLVADGFKIGLIRERDPFRDGFAVRCHEG